MKIYGDGLSGNCYKIQLLCSLIGLEYQWVEIDVLAGDTQSDKFLTKNPNGKIPLLELVDGRFISESNAILNYLAVGTNYLPDDNYSRAMVLQWQFFEQYSHEPYIAVARYIAKYLGLPDDRRADYESKQPGGHKALRVMENQLLQTDFLIGDVCTIADISLFAYTHVADEGGFDLASYPAILSWLARIKTLPDYQAMIKTA